MRPHSERALDLLCVGEALVDLLPEERGRKVRDVERWTRCSGGSPANVAIGAARLGRRTAFLGVVGEDEFGHFLRGSLEREGVRTHWMRQTREARTGLAFVSIADDGDRSFVFYRKPSAEFLLSVADVERAELEQARVVHFGTNSLLLPQAADAARELVKRARAAGAVVSCDPNLRLHVWDDPMVLHGLLRELLPGADVIKVAEDEAEFCTGERDPERAARALGDLGAELAIVTLGAAGALWCRNGAIHRVPAPQVEAIDATGAGDGFVSGLLSRLTAELEAGRALRELDDEEIADATRFACRVGSAVVTRLGAVAGLPRAGEQLP